MSSWCYTCHWQIPIGFILVVKLCSQMLQHNYVRELQPFENTNVAVCNLRASGIQATIYFDAVAVSCRLISIAVMNGIRKHFKTAIYIFIMFIYTFPYLFTIHYLSICLACRFSTDSMRRFHCRECFLCFLILADNDDNAINGCSLFLSL